MGILELWQNTDWVKLLLSPEGRLSRTHFWLLWMLPYILVFFILAFVAALLHINLSFITTIIYILTAIPNIMINIKRCHDRGKSGWFMLISFIPIIGAIWFLIEMCFLGSEPDNKYGPAPE